MAEEKESSSKKTFDFGAVVFYIAVFLIFVAKILIEQLHNILDFFKRLFH